MNTDLYIEQDTIIHRLDPRTKIFFFVVIFFLVAFFENPLWVLPGFSLVLCVGIISRSLPNLIKFRHILFIVTVTSLIMWTFFSKGDTNLFWIIETEALLFSISRVLFLLSTICAGVFLISTTRNEELIFGLIKIGLPYRVGFAISTAIRMVPTIVGTAFVIIQAQKCRGLNLDNGNLLSRIKKYIPMMVPIMISTFRFSNVFSMALDSKGFGVKKIRTNYLEIKLKLEDFIILGFCLLLLVFSLYLIVSGSGRIVGLHRF